MIDQGRIKGWVNHGVTQCFWTLDPYIRNPAHKYYAIACEVTVVGAIYDFWVFSQASTTASCQLKNFCGYNLHLIQNVFLTRAYIRNLFWTAVALIAFLTGFSLTLYSLACFYKHKNLRLGHYWTFPMSPIFGWLEDNIMLFLHSKTS